MQNPMRKYWHLVMVALLSCAPMAYCDQATMTVRPTPAYPSSGDGAQPFADRFAPHGNTILAIAACYDFRNEVRPGESPCFTFSTLPLPQMCDLTRPSFSGPFKGTHTTLENGENLVDRGDFETDSGSKTSATHRGIHVGQFDSIVRQNNVVGPHDGQGAPAEMSPLTQYPAATPKHAHLLVSPAAGPVFALPAIENRTDTAHYEGAKWNNASVITWSIADRPGTANSPFSGYMGSQYEAVVRQAFRTWATATDLTFEEVADSDQSDIRLGWGNFNTPSTGVVGYTAYEMESGQLLPNVIIRVEDPSQEPLVAGDFSARTYSGTVANLDQVILHEIGHALGLADTADPNSVMYYQATGSNNALDSNDIAGIQALYGSRAPAPQALQVAASTHENANNSVTR